MLQQAISAYVDELCVRPVHNYKRNTLETLYMFEIQDQEKLQHAAPRCGVAA
ncbi:MAG: hypothetical protein ACLR4E_09670 [Gemmiger formicilis]|uniref:hypothetical protein n=1 Tax=Gemmiger formicilis TaxID=745368 RepID=UPI003A30AD55